jgi:hypothetical protein
MTQEACEFREDWVNSLGREGRGSPSNAVSMTSDTNGRDSFLGAGRFWDCFDGSLFAGSVNEFGFLSIDPNGIII